MRIEAPWSAEVVDALNNYQWSGWHPYTCWGLDKTTGAHADYQCMVGGEFGQLVATQYGWICPVPGCDFRQSWADSALIELGRHPETIRALVARGFNGQP